jgi:hypothetical protein
MLLLLTCVVLAVLVVAGGLTLIAVLDERFDGDRHSEVSRWSTERRGAGRAPAPAREAPVFALTRDAGWGHPRS